MVWFAHPLVPVKVKLPTPPLEIFVSVIVGNLVLVKVQVKSAPALTFAARMVSTLPDRLPKEPVLPVNALLASVHEAAVSTKPAAGVSVNVMAVPIVVTLIAVGVAGVGVPAADVVMLPGALARLVWEKVKGPPEPPVVIFCTARVVVRTNAVSTWPKSPKAIFIV